jgi:ATPase subunit of ABC transporter with duplicated ATPase domains
MQVCVGGLYYWRNSFFFIYYRSLDMQNHLSVANLGYLLPDGSKLFSELNFKFNRLRTGLIGPNGVGKTTLLEILAGLREPSSGSVTRVGKISYLAQKPTSSETATVVEMIRFAQEVAAHERIAKGEGTSSDFEVVENCWDLLEKIETVFAKSGISYISLQQPAASLSGGELTRVRIAGLLLEEPDYLILDEPTNNLDISARQFVYRLAADWKQGLLVVSHDRALLSYIDQIAEMDSNGLKLYGGNFEFYQQQRSIEKAAAEKTLAGARQRLKDARITAQVSMQRQEKRNSSGEKRSFKKNLPPIAIGLLKRKAENSTAQLKGRHEMKVEQARQVVQEARNNLPEEHQITIDLENSIVPAQKRMIEAARINYRYPDAPRELWSEPLDFTIIGPERICIKGSNGSGKSTLVDIICGKKTPTAGCLKVGSTRIGVLDQKVSVLDDSLTVLENLKRVAIDRKEHEFRILLGRFLFYHDEVFKPASVLSGGERMRAGLACLLGKDQSPEILILDEPTNNLDLASIEEIVSALNNYRGVLIAISHDMTFLEEISIERTIDLI